MADTVVEVALPNKAVALVRAMELDNGGVVAEKVGWRDAFDLGHVTGMLEGVAAAVRAGLEKAKPSRAMVELGIDLVVKDGMLTGMLVSAGAAASLKVTLEWGHDQFPDDPPAP